MDQAAIIWLPQHNPRMALLTETPAILPDAPTLEAMKSRAIQTAPEGVYAELAALAPPLQALIMGEHSRNAPAGLILPLDALFEDHVDTARRLWRALVYKAAVQPASFTRQRRRRLKLVLRALDADLAGVGYRDIARVLLDARVPPGSAWRTHAARSSTIRLVQDGRALMRGGYLRLLRSDRRKR